MEPAALEFSLNTCNGCHGGETNTAFLHIFPRFEGEQSSLSGFLTGTTVFDPETGEERRMAELRRRRELLVKRHAAPGSQRCGPGARAIARAPTST